VLTVTFVNDTDEAASTPEMVLATSLDMREPV
jgi:hypothetical protein